MEKTSSFEELIVWQKAHSFVLRVYSTSEAFPKAELFGLTSQFRRAVVSVPANIAEGYKKRGPIDKQRFMNIAQGSLEECRYYLILSRDLGYLSEAHFQEMKSLSEEVGRLLHSYRKAIVL
jgi:four helix bundle protein